MATEIIEINSNLATTISSEVQQITNNLLNLFPGMDSETALKFALEIQNMEPEESFVLYFDNNLD